MPDRAPAPRHRWLAALCVAALGVLPSCLTSELWEFPDRSGATQTTWVGDLTLRCRGPEGEQGAVFAVPAPDAMPSLLTWWVLRPREHGLAIEALRSLAGQAGVEKQAAALVVRGAEADERTVTLELALEVKDDEELRRTVAALAGVERRGARLAVAATCDVAATASAPDWAEWPAPARTMWTREVSTMPVVLRVLLTPLALVADVLLFVPNIVVGVIVRPS